MRSRLLVIVLSLLALVLLGLGVPLARSIAGAAQQDLFLDRQGDTLRFAAIAQQPLVADRPEEHVSLQAELARYDQLYGRYGVEAAVVDADGRVVVSSRGTFDVDQPGVRERVAVALAGRPSDPYPLLMPWDDRPMVLAEPVVVDGRPSGAAVTVSSTAHLRQRVLIWWLVLLALGLVVLGVGAALFAVPVVRWILRPVRQLDLAAEQAAIGVTRGQLPEPVGVRSGPVELRRLTESFDRMARAVGEAMAAQRIFVADASHQLRNPLTALRLRLHNLDGHVADEAQTHYVSALDEVERLGTVLDGLLALARAEGGVGTTEPVDVDAVVEDRLEAWAVLAEDRDVRLRREGVRGLAVLAPHGVLDTVLDAVLDNALKFTAPGTDVVVSVTPVVETPSGKPAVEVAVRDHGPGLAPEELSRATGRFWRSPAHQNIPGSGLGLAIVRALLERSGGELRLELPGCGAGAGAGEQGGSAAPADRATSAGAETADDPRGLRVVLRLPAADQEDADQEDDEADDPTGRDTRAVRGAAQRFLTDR